MPSRRREPRRRSNRGTAIFLLAIAILAVVGLFLLFENLNQTNPTSTQASEIRIGWQTAWATQGQVVQALKRTNILPRNGLQGDFVGATYGGPLNEAAIAGDVDVIFTADQPAAVLISKTGNSWVIVARLMYNRVAIYVPPDSAVSAVDQLRGKVLAVPFGAAAQRDALKTLRLAGLDPNNNVEVQNLGIAEQAALVRTRVGDAWGTESNVVDALSGFDPIPAQFEHEGVARMLHVGHVVSVVVMKRDYLEGQNAAARAFLKSFIEGWFYYSRAQQQANQWFKADSGLSFDTSVLDIAAAVEPNINAKAISSIRPTFLEEDFEVMQEAADFLLDEGIIKVAVTMTDHVDTRIVEELMAELSEIEYDSDEIHLK